MPCANRLKSLLNGLQQLLTLKMLYNSEKILILHQYIVTLKTVVLLFSSDYKDTTFSEKLFLPLFWVENFSK